MFKTIEVPVIKRLTVEKAYDLHLSEEQSPSTSVSVDRKYIFSSPLILFPFISASLTVYGTYTQQSPASLPYPNTFLLVSLTCIWKSLEWPWMLKSK